MFGRPVPIWLIIAFLGYGVVGTARNLGAMLNGTQNYALFDVGVSALVAALSAWLIAEIWVRGSRAVWLAGGILGAMVVLYGVKIASIMSTSSQQELVAILTFVVAVIAVWTAIFFYLRHYMSRG
ncbi:hypothetical protein ADZ37_13505 [Pannonibacter phragmitetus]|uniref:hypothetical protein n=1 Tax=Pannonibacter phragmitetus TaxID=121719 RepID=UPI00067BF6F7|nr:hypothetical protein [Pannonibacter phragmitetus]KND18336.1 hypothetical protein ADZ37_13505 [Pannonibacter phragmitetus]